MQRIVVALFVMITFAACSASATPQALPIQPTDEPARATTIAANTTLQTGQEVYLRYCAHCHGFAGEGQISSTVPNTLSLGMNTVPAHNATGHSWQHPDQLLAMVVLKGIQNPLDQYPMPSFEGRITDEELSAVLEYIKLWWTNAQRQHQETVTGRREQIERELGINNAEG